MGSKPLTHRTSVTDQKVGPGLREIPACPTGFSSYAIKNDLDWECRRRLFEASVGSSSVVTSPGGGGRGDGEEEEFSSI